MALHGKVLLEDDSALDSVRRVIAAIVRRFRPPSSTNSEDLEQEALCRVCQALDRGEFRGDSSLTTYAANVAKYTCLEAIRRHRQTVELPENDERTMDRQSPELELLRDERRRRGMSVISSLPVDCLQLFQLVFVERRSYREVAALLGISEGALRKRIHRCRQSARRVRRRRESHG